MFSESIVDNKPRTVLIITAVVYSVYTNHFESLLSDVPSPEIFDE